MKFDLTLALADRPGQLLRSLEPIAKNGGNIISIIHERDKPVEGYVPVSLVVDFPSHQSFRRTIEDLRKLGVAVIKSEEVVEKARLSFILIGDVDVKGIIESGIKGMHIVGMEVSTSKLGEVSVRLEVEVSEGASEVFEELRRMAREQNILFIPPVHV